MRKPSILLLDGDDPSHSAMAQALRAHGFTIATGPDGGTLPPVVVVVPPGGSPEATCAWLIRWCAERQAKAEPATPGSREPLCDTRRMIGCSGAIEDVRDFIARVAPTDATVLITGETGTGKELVAELIHERSGRVGPLVPINCAAIPDGLLESELFGYERGAFTGATGSYEGKLRLANGGTVLLDEIGDMSPYAQAKLLRAIEKREVYRLGGRRPVALDVRIVAATNDDLERQVELGRFRKDLFFRLNVARVHLPPLRDRAEDVPALLQHSLDELRRQGRARARGFSAAAVECLSRYPWPGNVRELRNVVEIITLGAEGQEVGMTEVPPGLRGGEGACVALTMSSVGDEERDRVLAALRTTRWNKSRAAQQLQWSRMTLYRKMAKYHISVTDGGGRPDALSRPRPGVKEASRT